jgi:DNA-binding transcriptional LysR family regulator
MGVSEEPLTDARPVVGLPDLTSLELFATVIRLGSVSRAAAAHHVSQPAASARISRLERQLGLTLLERRTSGSQPTREGALVVEWSLSVLDAARELVENVRSMRSPHAGHLRVAASFTIAEHLIPQWLVAFRRSRSGTRVELDVANSAEVEEKVLAHDVDLGFVEGVGVRAGLDWLDVADDELVVVVGATHPWRDRREPLGAHELAGAALVVREAGSGTRAVLEQALHEAGAPEIRPVLELGSTVAIKNAVADGIGVGVVSSLAVTGERTLGMLHLVATSGFDSARALRAVWRASEPPRREARAFLTSIQEHRDGDRPTAGRMDRQDP